MKSLLRVCYFVPILAGSMFLTACSQGEVGEQVFMQQCSSCHNTNSTDRKMGPALKGLFNHEKLNSTGRKVTEDNVRAWINKGGKGMPSFQKTLSDEQIEHVLRYLKTL